MRDLAFLRVDHFLRELSGPWVVAVLQFGFGHVDGALVVGEHAADEGDVDVGGLHALIHFGLHLVEGVGVAELDALQLPLLGTSSHAAQALHEVVLPWPCAWLMGHEGQGVEAVLAARCAALLRIPQPGGEESLNVAAAGAICLYESTRRRER